MYSLIELFLLTLLVESKFHSEIGLDAVGYLSSYIFSQDSWKKEIPDSM